MYGYNQKPGMPQGQPGYGMQGQPPQGYAMQGQPPQGFAMQCQPPEGYAVEGQPPKGYAMQGQPSQGYSMQDQAPQGYGMRGQPPQGYAVQGQPPQGFAMQGQPPEGYAMEGQPPQGYAMQGQPSQGYSMQDQPSQDYGMQNIPQLYIPAEYDESVALHGGEYDQSYASSFYAPSAAQPPSQYQQEPAGQYGVSPDSQGGRSGLPTSAASTGASSSMSPSAYTNTGTGTTTTPGTGSAAQAPVQPAQRTEVVVSPHSTLRWCCITIVCGIFLVVVGGVGFIGVKLYLNRSHGEVKPIKTEQGPTSPSATTRSSRSRVFREPMILCTVNLNFEEISTMYYRSKKFPCDYLIYSDLIGYEDGFMPTGGNYSWYWFKQVFDKFPLVRGGISFSLAEGAQPNGTLDRMESRLPDIRLLLTQNVVALGTFDYDPTAFEMAHMKRFLQVLFDAKWGVADQFEVMLFLGVVIGSKIIAEAFVSEFVKMPKIDTIIFQTHILLKDDSYGGQVDCHTYPISAIGPRNLANSSQPTLTVAAYAANLTRDAGDKFRVLFSSTMGVMVYMSKKGSYLSGFRQPCQTYQMGDFDLVCSVNVTTYTEYDDISRFGFSMPPLFMYSFEDSDTITAKMREYVPMYSDGWCLFDIMRDVYHGCDYQLSSTEDTLHRVEVVYNEIDTIKRRRRPAVPGK